MKQIEGIYWPDDVGESWLHALQHLRSLEWALEHCTQHRVAIQAGGNCGLWPRRMAEVFTRVITFEPDHISRECLLKNVPKHVEVRTEAVGDYFGACAIKHRGLGSHRVVEGGVVHVVPIDSFNLTEVDLLQLDVEGYEWHALKGAEWTIRTNRPVIQIELRDFTQKYGRSVSEVQSLLHDHQYVEVSRQPGSDVVYLPVERIPCDLSR